MIGTDSHALWRISNYPNLSGKGGLKAAGRWHSRGRLIVYLAESAAGALLETLAHTEIDGEDVPESYSLLKVSVPDGLEIQRLDTPAGVDWKSDQKLTQSIGDAWLKGKQALLARVPSAIVSETWNYLLNPEHPDAAQLHIVAVTQERYDPRLFRFGPR